MSPVISIIVPCSRISAQLYKCLNSIYEQTIYSRALEIIVLNNSNEDIKLKEDYLSENLTFISEPDLGVYHAMNKGLELAQGNWLYFMGIDDEFHDKHVLEEIYHLIQKGDSKLILGKIIYKYTSQDSRIIKKNNGVVTPKWSFLIWFKNTLPHQGMFYHKSVFYKNSYDLRYKVLADYDLNLSLWKKRLPVLITNKIIANCETGGLSKQYNKTLYKEEILLKSRASTFLFMPFFTMLAVFKFSFKNF